MLQVPSQWARLDLVPIEERRILPPSPSTKSVLRKERDDVAMTLPGALVSIAGRFGVADRPNPGFKESDSFSYAVTSNENYRGGAGLVAHVMLNVISE